MFLCVIHDVNCNEWTNHGDCVSGSSVTDANLAITKYYLHAYYAAIPGSADISYDINGKNYRVWLDKNLVFPYLNDSNRKSWQGCNVGRSACGEDSTVSGGGACCYQVSAYFGVALECVKMDIK